MEDKAKARSKATKERALLCCSGCGELHTARKQTATLFENFTTLITRPFFC